MKWALLHTIFHRPNFPLCWRLMMIRHFLSLSLYDDYCCQQVSRLFHWLLGFFRQIPSGHCAHNELEDSLSAATTAAWHNSTSDSTQSHNLFFFSDNDGEEKKYMYILIILKTNHGFMIWQNKFFLKQCFRKHSFKAGSKIDSILNIDSKPFQSLKRPNQGRWVLQVFGRLLPK